MTKIDIISICVILLALLQIVMFILFFCKKEIQRNKSLLVDLDGVLNTYCGSYIEGEIPPPKEGAEKFLEKLSQHFNVEVYTVRDLKQTIEWLIKYKLDKYISNVSNVKNPKATVIIDDRALRFEGDYDKTFNDIINFQPYWK